MHVRSWQAAYAGLLPDDFLQGLSIESATRTWATRLAEPRPDGAILVTSGQGSAIAGFAATGPSRDEDASPETGELYSIYLLPTAWRHGLGTALHDHAMTTLAGTFATATLWVLSTNTRARRFYERAGWTPDPRTKIDTVADGRITLEEVRYRFSLRDRS
ncbi:GNAT family N-acetyltransferase [Amycolatopsis panacis]|uniref:GNAT family N-acetyltransferase n=1 Tax=Amycolatopsis panacis TaxID=2340917 RepID=UPI001F3B8407|nr:GNAT family N-acetyltransferase [Amycolatopsis panacis]